MTEENAARGLANRRAGKRAMARAVDWLRRHGAPSADVVTRHHASDLTGVGDVAIEVTIEAWQQLGKKAMQAQADARRRGLDEWVIWKPRQGKGDFGQAWAITSVAQFWELRREVEVLRNQVTVLRNLFNVPSGETEIEEN